MNGPGGGPASGPSGSATSGEGIGIPSSPSAGGLPTRLLAAGAAALLARRVAGMALALGGNLVLARVLGPKAFGLYAAASFVSLLLSQFTDLGVGRYIVSRPRLDERDLRVAFTASQALTAAALAASLVLGPLVGLYFGEPRLAWLVAACGAALWISSPGKVLNAALEREMRYERVAAVELASNAGYYAAGAAAALSGWGLMSFAAAELAQAAACTLAALRARPSRLGFAWDPEALRAGGGYSGATAFGFLALIQQGVNPFVVGKMAGLEAAGAVRMAYSLLSQLGFFHAVGWRMSIPLGARLRETPGADAALAGERLTLYVLAGTALPVLAAAGAGPGGFELLLGPKWAPVAIVYLAASLPFLVRTVVNFQAAYLYSSDRVWDAVSGVAWYSGAFAALAVPATAAFGAPGLPLAELAACAGYARIHRGFREAAGRAFRYGPFAALAAPGWAAAAAGFWLGRPWAGAALAAGTVMAAAVAVPSSRRALAAAWSDWRFGAGGR